MKFSSVKGLKNVDEIPCNKFKNSARDKLQNKTLLYDRDYIGLLRCLEIARDLKYHHYSNWFPPVPRCLEAASRPQHGHPCWPPSEQCASRQFCAPDKVARCYKMFYCFVNSSLDQHQPRVRISPSQGDPCSTRGSRRTPE